MAKQYYSVGAAAAVVATVAAATVMQPPPPPEWNESTFDGDGGGDDRYVRWIALNEKRAPKNAHWKCTTLKAANLTSSGVHAT